MPPSRWASVDWPRELLADELEALMADPYWAWEPEHIAGLLREAFHHAKPVEAFERVSSADGWLLDVTPVDGSPPPVPDGQLWIRDLLAHLPELRMHRPPTPLWRARQAGVPTDDDMPEDPRQAVAELLRRFAANGYFAKRFPESCFDDELDEHGEPLHEGDAGDRIRRHLARETWHSGRDVELWPAPSGWSFWSEETFYEVIEALHDVVARSRSRWYHEDRECGWHFSQFDPDSGRRIYRALVNRVLVERNVGLRLADAGEDEGRLVRVTDEARSELIERALASPDPEAADEVLHAISLFRRREATTHDKRSAIVALHRILEKRKGLLKAALFSADEDALSLIANRFDLRHSNEKQHTDYDPAFHDWVFWWYLATIELTDRLRARQASEESA